MPLQERTQLLLERSRAPRPPPNDRLYNLKDGEGYFDAGVLPDGRQALMASFYTGTFGLFFDAQGQYLAYELHSPKRGQDLLAAWQAQLGFKPRPIRVRAFWAQEQSVGIEELPGYLQDFLEDPESEPDPAERQELARIAREWLEEGSFVLYWGNDLFLDEDGHVTSSQGLCI